MNKAVLMSIKPHWCDLIRSGRKTVEVRKNRPMLDVPFKAYIYETQDGGRGCGMVIGEFVCAGFDIFTPVEEGVRFKRFRALWQSCLSLNDFKKYAQEKPVYGWQISDLKIYDKPRSLYNFCRFDFQSMNGTNICGNTKCENYIPSNSWMQPPECAIDGCYLKYPPQSWCYVQEKVEK